MNSDSLVDPELRPVLEVFKLPSFADDTLPHIRDAFLQMLAAAPMPEGLPATASERLVPGPDGAPPVRLLIYRPTDVTEPAPAIYQIHGGGYVIGAAHMLAAAHLALAAALRCVIVAVDYRLAPETPFPGAIEDAYAGLKWLHANAGEIGVDPARVGVSGESAGGGLAAALALLARDRGEIPLAFQHLIYPMLDDRTCVATDANPFVGEYVWTPADNRFGWSALLGQAPGGEGVSPYAAPARATDLAGLPPAFVMVGALDLFLEEDIDYARRLTRAGVPVELHVYPGAFHAFDLAPAARVSLQAVRDSQAFLKRSLFP